MFELGGEGGPIFRPHLAGANLPAPTPVVAGVVDFENGRELSNLSYLSKRDLEGEIAEPLRESVGVELQEGDAISIVVEDDGHGHSRAQVERIFDPSPGGGDGDTGLDLCVADQIVRQHAGQIRMDSILGQGSTVTVRLPIAGSDSNRVEGETHDRMTSRGEPA